MKDDHLQGILFSKTETVRFREVPLPPQNLFDRARKRTKLYRDRNKNSQAATATDYIEYAVISKS